MTHDRNLFNGCLHLLWYLDNSWQTGIALHDALEEIAEYSLYLTVDQIVDLKLVKPPRFFKLPGPWTANNNFRPVFLDNRMRDNFDELMRVERHQVLAEDFGVNVGGIGDAKWVVRVNGKDLRVRADKLIEIVEVTGDDIFL